MMDQISQSRPIAAHRAAGGGGNVRPASAGLRVTSMAAVLCAAAGAALTGPPASASNVEEVLEQLNSSALVDARPEATSYRILFDAYLEMTAPPMEVGRDFSLASIHPEMYRWADVEGWAESNPGMAEAIKRVKGRAVVGLPYGRDNVSSTYRQAGLYAHIGAGGSLRTHDFAYVDAVEVIAAYATAEVYRLMEAGQIQEGLDLAVAHIDVSRRFCDRDFLVEKLHSISLLTEALSNLRDIFWRYREHITPEQFRHIAVSELPFLRPDYRRLFMPEGDRIVSEALIREVFDRRGQADREKFAEIFAEIQSQDAPLTRFGAARRWRIIADFHGSLDASLERLTMIYDDWWRRWRVQEYDPILAISTEFSRTNPIRYAAVIYSIQDIESLFNVRQELIVATNGTALAAGLCAYYNTFHTWPSDHQMMFGQFVRKASDLDPFDREFGHFLYFIPGGSHALDTAWGRLWIESGQGILYSRGQNHRNDRAAQHTDDGAEGDIVVWPPIKALMREQGVID